ncbi:MAG: MFS transporter [Sporomusaceae bacterium]|nr:MFS transporter [Sporomusaceae bacterium]
MNQSTDTARRATAEKAGSYRWVILALNTGVQAAHACITTAVGTLAPFLIADLGLTKAMIGMAGGAVNIGMSFTAVLAGRLADKKGEKVVLVAGSLLTGIAIIITSQAASYSTLLTLLILTGAGASTPTPAGSKTIQRWFPEAKLGFALGIRQTGIPLGGFFGALILPLVAATWGWQAAMVTAGVLTIAGGVVYYFLYRESPAAQIESQNFRQKNTAGEWLFLRDINLWLVIFMSIIFIGAQFDMLTYLVLYLHDQVGLSVTVASACLAITQLGGIVARITLGFMSDTVFKGARKPALIILGVIMTATVLSLTLFNPGMPFWVVAVVSWFFGVSAMGWNGIFVALAMKLAGKEHGGAVVGFCLMIMQIGVLVFPPLFGLLIDITGSYQSSWITLAGAVLLGTLLIARVHEPGPETGRT